MIKLGQVAKCKITGFEGTAIARTEWLNGCTRVTLQGKVDKDGKVPDTYTFDEPQLELVAKSTYKPEPSKKTGGPIPAPSRNSDPTR